MKVNEILEFGKSAVDRVEITTEQFNTCVYRGPSNMLNHCLSQETLAPYLDRDVIKFVVSKSTLCIYCK